MANPRVDLARLRGRSILIADSSPLIALDLASTMAAWGAQPVVYHELAPAGSRAPPPDLAAAVVDVDLPIEQHADLIDDLQRNSVPTILTTSWAKDAIVERFPGLPVLEKPVQFEAIAKWLAEHA